jgi:hypothetical protein
MDSFNEKKWHVFFAGKQEGPFSMEELRSRFAPGGGLDSSAFAWCNGMTDWEMVTRIGDFGAILNPPPSEQRTSSLHVPQMEPALGASGTDSSPAIAAATQPITSLEPTRSVLTPLGSEKTPQAEAAPSGGVIKGSVPPTSSHRAKKTGVSKGFLFSLFLLTLVGGAGFASVQGYFDPLLQQPAVRATLNSLKDGMQPLVFQLVEKIPALGQVISPLPALRGVAESEREELKQAILGSPEMDGARIAFAVDQSDLQAPAFFVVSNLPDGTSFEVRVEGVADRLLNVLQFSATLKATLQKRIGQTGILRQADGRPIPRGEYQVYIYESDQQSEQVGQILTAMPAASVKVPLSIPQGRKLMMMKTLFLGGLQDATYTESLKAFHESILAKVSTERQDAGQYLATLESQLAASTSLFDRLAKGKINKSQLKQWESFHSNWTQMDGQLQEVFQKWTPEVLQSEFFYGVVFQALQQAGQAVTRVHGIHHGYFSGVVDSSSFSIQRGEAQSQASFALNAVRAKLEQVDRLPKSPAGIPLREGL